MGGLVCIFDDPPLCWGQLAPPVIEDLIHCKAGAVETFLHTLQYKMAKFKAVRSTNPHPVSSRPAGSHSGPYSDDEVSPPGSARQSPSPKRPQPSHAHHPPGTATSMGGGTGPTRSQERSNGAGQDNAPRMASGARGGQGSKPRERKGLMGPSKAGRDALQREVDEEILLDKEETIQVSAEPARMPPRKPL
jgi:hypothetical protein